MNTNIQASEISDGHDGVARSDRVANILDASVTLFSTVGYANVSIKDIAKEAKTSTALIYYHFADKEGLLRKSVCRAVEKILSHFEVEKSQSGAAEFDVWLHVNAADNLQLQRLLIMLIDLRGLCGGLSGVDECIHAFYDLETRIIKGFLKEGRDNHEYPGSQLEDLTDLVSTCLDGVMVRSMIWDGFDINAAFAEVRSLMVYYRDHYKEDLLL